MVRSILSCEIRAMMNSTNPTGGVSKPIMRFNTMTRPKCMGSMPSCCATGTKMGTKIVMAATGSKKQPIKSISTFASNKNIHASVVTPKIHDAISAVIPSAVNIQLKILEAATMNITTAVVSTVSMEIRTNCFKFIERYQNRPKNSAQIHAAIAPSVGVNKPTVMPPISKIGVSMGMTATNLNL